MSRLYAIPDIHGEYDLLQELLGMLRDEDKLDLTTDKLVFLGDMIDRGPNSKGVLDLIRKLTEDAPENVVALAGNHEYLAINTYARRKFDDLQLWLYNGGGATLASYPNDKIDDDTVRWLSSLPLSHEDRGYFFSHAPCPCEEDRLVMNKGQPFTRDELIWTYDPAEGRYARNFKEDDDKDLIGVCGHVHRLMMGVEEPRFYDHYIFADAGCGCAKYAPLVAIRLDRTSSPVVFTVRKEEKKS